MEKNKIRQQVIKQLEQKDQKIKHQQEQAIYQKLFADPFWQAAQTIGITMSLPHELATYTHRTLPTKRIRSTAWVAS